MELCYDGALVMPSSYVAVTSDEMEYIEGGLKVWQKAALIAGIVACGVGLAVALAYGQVWLAATLMSKTIGAMIDAYGAAVVVPFVVCATGISYGTVAAAVKAVLKM